MGFFERLRNALKAKQDNSALEGVRVSFEKTLAEGEHLDLLREQEALKVDLELIEMQPIDKQDLVWISKINTRIREIDRIINTAKAEAEKQVQTQIT